MRKILIPALKAKKDFLTPLHEKWEISDSFRMVNLTKILAPLSRFCKLHNFSILLHIHNAIYHQMLTPFHFWQLIVTPPSHATTAFLQEDFIVTPRPPIPHTPLLGDEDFSKPSCGVSVGVFSLDIRRSYVTLGVNIFRMGVDPQQGCMPKYHQNPFVKDFWYYGDKRKRI